MKKASLYYMRWGLSHFHAERCSAEQMNRRNVVPCPPRNEEAVRCVLFHSLQMLLTMLIGCTVSLHVMRRADAATTRKVWRTRAAMEVTK